ncbi:MAG: CvpA family protein, partial [Clostridia bacterium]
MKKRSPVSILVRIVLCVVALFLLFWFKLPPINFRSGDFWNFVILSIIICVVINAFSTFVEFFKNINVEKQSGYSVKGEKSGKEMIKGLGKPVLISLGAIIIIIVLSMLSSLIGAEIFNAKNYNQLLTLTDGNFNTDVSELQMSQIPVVDRDTASRLGQRKLGEMTDLVSQFEIEENYTQINYKNRVVRVTPLEYNGFFKYFSNRSDGVMGYITVDSVDGSSNLVKLEKGMKILPSALFNENLYRQLRFQYPTFIFGEESFEVDESGKPFWVVPVMKYKG